MKKSMKLRGRTSHAKASVISRIFNRRNASVRRALGLLTGLVMLSAAPMGHAIDAAYAKNAAPVAASLGSETSNASSYYIDNALPDANILADALKYQKYQSNDTYQLFSHGRPGELLIDGQWQGVEGITRFIKQQNSDFSSLNIYGCDFAKGEKGKQAVLALQNALGVNVAASDNITGKEGDWTLEVGQTTAALSVPQYAHSLQDVLLPATFVPDAGSDGASGSLTLPSGGSADFTLGTSITSPLGTAFIAYGGVSDNDELAFVYDNNNGNDYYDVEVDFSLTNLPATSTLQMTLYGFTDAVEVSGYDGFGARFDTYTITWVGGGAAILYDPAEQIDGGTQSITSGTPFTQKTNYGNSSLEWYVLLPLGVTDFTLLAEEGRSLEGFRFSAVEVQPADTDGDGVADFVDFDDDNDGILDTDEGLSCLITPTTLVTSLSIIDSSGIGAISELVQCKI